MVPRKREQRTPLFRRKRLASMAEDEHIAGCLCLQQVDGLKVQAELCGKPTGGLAACGPIEAPGGVQNAQATGGNAPAESADLSTVDGESDCCPAAMPKAHRRRDGKGDDEMAALVEAEFRATTRRTALLVLGGVLARTTA